MAITSLEQFKAKAFQEVTLPGFEKGGTVTVRLRRVSILGLASSGKIPNSLMGTVKKLFDGTKRGVSTESAAVSALDNLTEMSRLLEVIAEQALIEPKYSEIRDLLTDDQKNAIFEYSQEGITALAPSDSK